MSISAPPRPPSPARTARDSEPLEREEIEALVQALIEEARRETRRRRRRYSAIAALVVFVGVVVLVLLEGGAASQPASPAASARSSLPAGVTTSKIAFISEPPAGGYCGTVYVMNFGRKRAAKADQRRGPWMRARSGPAWSPDGRRIALGLRVPPERDGTEHFEDRRHEPRRERRTEVERRVRSVLVAGRTADRVRANGLLVMNADGSGERELSNAASLVSAPAWSSDGQRIAFVANARIYVVNADGSGQRRLTRNTVRFSDPVWSPDGRRIAFESNWQVCGHERRWQRAATADPQRGAQLQSCMVAGWDEDRVRARKAATQSMQLVPRFVGLRRVRHERRRERSAAANARCIATSLVAGRAEDRLRQPARRQPRHLRHELGWKRTEKPDESRGKSRKRPVWSPAQR